jgi:DNA-directed RNA polymerase specialized sigma24 family protein
MSQRTLGELLGVARTTVNRWASRGLLRLTDSQALTLVTALLPVDRALAAEVAAVHGETLEALGLVPPATKTIDPAHLVDSVVCAAADAGSIAPASLRPALRAAFLRAKAVGLSIDEVLAALKTPASASGPAPDGANVAVR